MKPQATSVRLAGLLLLLGLSLWAGAASTASAVVGASREPTWEALDSRPNPAWFAAANVGILLPPQVIERPAGSFASAPRICQSAVLDRWLTRVRELEPKRTKR